VTRERKRHRGRKQIRSAFGGFGSEAERVRTCLLSSGLQHVGKLVYQSWFVLRGLPLERRVDSRPSCLAIFSVRLSSPLGPPALE
jgi:hypothetical protein